MVSPAASMEFRITGIGWADCELRLGERAFTMGGISYLTDAIGDLLRMALMVATGAVRATVSFDCEPMEWRIVATGLTDMNGNGPVSITVFSFAQMSDAPLGEGFLEFTGDCDARDFVKAILAGAKKALADPGMKHWGYFPPATSALRALEHALGES